MHKILRIARREYIEIIRTKAFVISLLVAPLLVAVLIYFSAHKATTSMESQPPRRIVVNDLTGQLASGIRGALESHNQNSPEQQVLLDAAPGPDPADAEKFRREQKERVRRGELDAYVEVDSNAIDGPGKTHVHTRRARPSDLALLRTIGSAVNQAAFDRRCEVRNVDRQLMASLNRYVPAEHVDLGEAEGQEKVQNVRDQLAVYMVPFFFMFLMFMGVTAMSQFLLSSVVEEKGSRIIEVLLSAVSPTELLAGKILGMVAVGLTAVSVWVAFAGVAAHRAGISLTVGPEILPWFLAYYLLGFLLIGSLLAAAGSICNTLKEAQSLVGPVMMLMTAPMIIWFLIAQNPDGTLARVLSFIPPLTPMIMVLRIAASSELSLLEILATLVVLAASVPLAMWAGAKIFRTGILMYGKRPRLREVARWLRQT